MGAWGGGSKEYGETLAEGVTASSRSDVPTREYAPDNRQCTKFQATHPFGKTTEICKNLQNFIDSLFTVPQYLGL